MNNKLNSLRFPLFLLLSIGLHITLLFMMIHIFREDLSKIFLSPPYMHKPKILVDLTEPRNDLYDPKKNVISRYNYAGKGKLIPKPGQHLTGDFNPITMPESTSIKKANPQISLEEEKEVTKTKRMEVDQKLATFPNIKDSKNIKKPDDSIQKSSSLAEKIVKEKNSRLAIDTEDSLENKFWFDESEFLQISARNHPDAEFSIELANLLKKRFANYVLGGGVINFYHVKRDQATSLATIDHEGKINFKKLVSASKTQPYINYLVSRVVDDPGIVKNLPKELDSGKSQPLYFLFNIQFTGEPLRKWWMGFEFLPQSPP